MAYYRENEYFEGETFENLSLTGETIYGCEFIDCTFKGCTVSDCVLLRCSFSECAFLNCTVSGLKTDNTEVRFLEFTKCTLHGINWSLVRSTGLSCEPVQKLVSCRLKYNTFGKINFRRFHFSGTDITNSTFAECNLAESDFRKCDLTDTEFYRCDMTKADFRSAVGYRADIMSCKLKNARFSYPEVVNLLYCLDIKIE